MPKNAGSEWFLCYQSDFQFYSILSIALFLLSSVYETFFFSNSQTQMLFVVLVIRKDKE